MKADLLDLISYSDKRKGLLILLQEGPKTLDEIKTRLNVTATGMLPQIRKLEKRNLVRQVDRGYVLTELGEVLTLHLKPLLKTLKVIEDNEEFWSTHDLKAIPPNLLGRIGELGECKLIERGLDDWFKEAELFIKYLSMSKWIVGISPIYHPSYPTLFLKLAESGIDVTLILNKPIYDRVKNENQEDLRKFLALKNAKMFTAKEDIKIALVTTDRLVSIFLFFKDGSYDPKRDLYTFEPSAIKWGKELFEFYLKDAKQITL